jgi:hypothetical protein
MNLCTFPKSFVLAVALALPGFLCAAEINTKGAKPRRVAFGERINLADYAVPGKTTVIDFTSN